METNVDAEDVDVFVDEKNNGTNNHLASDGTDCKLHAWARSVLGTGGTLCMGQSEAIPHLAHSEVQTAPGMLELRCNKRLRITPKATTRTTCIMI